MNKKIITVYFDENGNVAWTGRAANSRKTENELYAEEEEVICFRLSVDVAPGGKVKEIERKGE